MGYVAIGCQGLLGLVFAVAVGGKLRSPAAFRAFAGSLAHTRLVPWRKRYPTAAALAGAELVTLVLLVAVPVTAGFAAALVVLAVLTAGAALTVRRGIQAPCRCFGGASRPLSAVHVVRNAALAAVAALGLLAGPPAGLHGAGVAVAVASATVLALLTVRLDDIVELVRPPAVTPHPSK